MLDNIILMTDSYKATHWKMYPPRTSKVYSYLEARIGGEYPEVVFFGLQYLLQRYLEGERVTRKNIEIADAFFLSHFGQNLFNKHGWEYIVDVHCGKLPVEIRAVSEGTVIPEGNVMLTIENTDPKCAWLTNHLETLLVQLWYSCTVATTSREQKKVIIAALEKSGTPDLADLKLHDFGYRGSSSPESAAIGGAAHLIHFRGTDTLAACEFAMKYYNADMPGISIPAAEHSTITAWGKDAEKDVFQHILEMYPTGLVSIVSDSWDIQKACKIWGTDLKHYVVPRNGTLVIRPDSGQPEKIVPDCLEILGESFGYKMNDKGYKVLPDSLRLIQGDGITRHTLGGIVDAILQRGWSLDNVAFGSGGGLLQRVNRDTQRFAMKCSYVVIDGKGREVCKTPTSDLTKKSKGGRLKLIKKEKIVDDNTMVSYKTVPESSHGQDELKVIFRDGQIKSHIHFDQVRKNARVY